MRFKNKILTSRGKLYTAILIIVSIILIYLLLFHPPQAEATKSTVFELKEPGEPYDGKVKCYRTSDNTYVIYTDGQTILIKDGSLSAPGNISGKGKLGPNVLIVDKDGAGDFTTIQSAINSIIDSSAANPYVLYIMPGVYQEQVIINNKSYISLVGIQPKGGKIIKAQNSGVIIKYQSSGAGNDLMTFWILGGGANDVKGITLANLTIINTQVKGVGPAQIALDIGRTDTYPRAHEVFITNCRLYGEQDTVFINTGNPVFQNCYIEGDLDICSIADDTTFSSCFIHSHTGAKLLWIGRTGDTAFSVNIFNSTFSKALPGFWYIGIFAHNNPTLSLYNCTLLPNAANGTNWDWNSKTATLNIFSTNGENWGTGVTYLKHDTLRAKRDGFFERGINVGTATGAGTGDGNFSGSVDLDVKLTHAPPTATDRTIAWTVAHWPGSQRQWFDGKMWYAMTGSGTIYYYVEIKLVGGNHFYGATPKLKKLTVYYYTVDEPDYITQTGIAYQNLGAPGVTVAYNDNTDRGQGSLGYANYSIEPNLTLSQNAPYFFRFVFVQGDTFHVKIEAIKVEIDWE